MILYQLGVQSMADKINLFDVLKNIIHLKDLDVMEKHIAHERFDKDYRSHRYMLHRYLSMSDKYKKLILADQQILDALNNENHYRYLMRIIPKGAPFIKYIK